MKNHQAVGMVVGSLIGCILAGVLAYLHVSIVIICLCIWGSLLMGSYIGSKLKTNNSKFI